MANTNAEGTSIPLPQWTHDGDKVLLVKCVEKGGGGYGGFVWPPRGSTRCPQAAADRAGAANVTGNKDQDCASGGLFGWPWGVNLGGGKEPDYRGDWIVFAAPPADVIDLRGKAKAVGEVEIVYYGDALGALIFTLPGRIAWIEQNSKGIASATGWRGSASATGWRGSASATGWSGSASATGERGIAALSGEKGTIRVEKDALGAVTAREWTWHVCAGSVVCCRWQDESGAWKQLLLVADELGLNEGQIVQVKDGQWTGQ